MSAVIKVRNVNEALRELRDGSPQEGANWRKVSPRGKETLEFRGTVITEYAKPMERVLFSPERDANPFFHFFESLWILAGRNDVAYLEQFLPSIAQFSDNGKTFHGAYGHRLRHCHYSDQLGQVMRILRNEPSSRQAVLQIWIADEDLGVAAKDIPCNDLIFLKVREDKLEMTVCCRSNDAIWGAYGANAVQFSMLQEFLAGAIGVDVGVYRQVSDSFHIYTDNEAWKRLNTGSGGFDQESDGWQLPDISDYYSSGTMKPYPIIEKGDEWQQWLHECGLCLNDGNFGIVNQFPRSGIQNHFFIDVAQPMYIAWKLWKNDRDINGAQQMLNLNCMAEDWRLACTQWLERRRK